MNVQLMQQFYEETKYIYDKKAGKQITVNPKEVRDIEFEMSITENTNTPAYRLMINDLLFQLKQFDTTNMLDLRGILEAGSLPFKDELLNYLNKRDEEMRNAAAGQLGQQGTPQGLPPELADKLGQYQFSPDALAQFAQLPEETRNDILGLAP